MSLFKCEGCGAVENTALCNFWLNQHALCSECDPDMGVWHGVFPKEDADKAGYTPIPDSRFIEKKATSG